MNSSGKLKAIAGGTGATLSDPLTVANGGTGFTSAPKGGVIYASAANTWALRIPDTDSDVYVPKAFCNLLLPGETAASNPILGLVPRWVTTSFFGQNGSAGVARPAAFKGRGPRPGWTLAQGNVIGNWGTSIPTGCEFTNMSTSTPDTFVFDSTSTWQRYSTAAAGATAFRITTTGLLTWAQWNPTVEWKFRTGSSVSGYRLMIAIKDSTAFTNNTDDHSARKGVGIRYSSASSDGGFVPWSSNGTTQTIGSTITTIAADTTYVISIGIEISTATIIITTGSTTTTATVALPPEMNSLNLVGDLSLGNSSGAGTKDIDMAAVYSTLQTFIS